MAAAPSTSKSYTISLSGDLASKVEALAQSEERTMSELFEQALDAYYGRRAKELLDEATSYASTRNPHGYSEADVPRLIKEVRASAAAKLFQAPGCKSFLIVVIDTNVWVSALHFGRDGSVPFRALQRALERDIIATCPELQLEIFRGLTEKFAWEAERTKARLDRLYARSLHVTLTHTTTLCRDPNDNMFLECAALAKADLLVAGDKDLLVLGSFQGTRILTPLEYILIET